MGKSLAVHIEFTIEWVMSLSLTINFGERKPRPSRLSLQLRAS